MSLMRKVGIDLKRIIICEDSGSGLKFFSMLSEIYRCDCTVISTCGNLKYRETMIGELLKLSKGDCVLLAFDNVVPTKKFSVHKIIKLARSIASRVGINVWYTRYYCFEEVYLSYKGYLDFCETSCIESKSLIEWMDSLRFVQECIMRSIDYFVVDNAPVHFVKNYSKLANRNREKFCKVLLENTSRLLRCGNFTISSGDFGDCWLSPCILDSNSFRLSKCEYCKFILKSSAVDKLADLESNSISSLYLGFSEFFK